jgi:glycosyltransferase involved in cell wall biosynthesis
LRHAAFADRHREMIHLHWIEMIVKSNSKSKLAGIYGVVSGLHLVMVLALARARGVRVVWTVHNLAPHESRRPWLDRRLSRLVARISSLVLVHSRHAAQRAEAEFGHFDIEVAYHGNYVGFYPEGRPREAVRRSLAIPPEAHVFLAFGLVRRYKRLPELIAEFRRLDDDDMRLVIAGATIREEERRRVEEAASGDDRVLLLFERIPDGQVYELHRAADVATFAYDDLFSSGALLVALSCDVPVIAPSNSTATELAGEPAVLPFETDRLDEALRRSALDLKDHEGLARRAAERYTWDDMAGHVLGCFS